ncbi:hypothetical protein [Paracoccus sp. IB05]|uniref:hypothetical protein n=1 Tax=Paracoccus sp. IB05 TaxID=2779367 RepID=UPI0018E7A01F|nr:hypothetical protein [Paracoccus sp. IB05]MBJ2150540.1 hypothetical protein [Paracoccus sp. IB05]
MEHSPAQHPVAIEHLPGFITAPGQADMLLNGVIVFLILMVLLTGVFYLKLHSLPERMMHGAHPAQFQIVAVLGLISLLTHNQIFWIAALLLAMIDVPSLLAPLTSMSRSLHRLSVQPGRRERRRTRRSLAEEVPDRADEIMEEIEPEEVTVTACEGKKDA